MLNILFYFIILFLKIQADFPTVKVSILSPEWVENHPGTDELHLLWFLIYKNYPGLAGQAHPLTRWFLLVFKHGTCGSYASLNWICHLDGPFLYRLQAARSNIFPRLYDDRAVSLRGSSIDRLPLAGVIW